MSCQIELNNNGSISRVNTPNGEEARLFNSLAKFPHINSLEEALESYKLKYKKEYNGNENLEFISDKGNSFQTFKEALLDSFEGEITLKSGEDILMKVSSDTNQDTISGTINHLIKENVLSDERVIDQGKSYLKSFGNSDVKQIITENYVNEHKDKFKVLKNGLIEIREDFKVESNLVADTIKKLLKRDFGTNKPLIKEEDLKSRLFEFLKDIGVTVTNLEKSENVRALADISNQIVAFKEGRIELADLSEETAHFIVEGWNEAEIDNITRLIHKTNSYQEFSETYRQIYSRENPNFSAEEIEKLVRREILGKELSKALINNFTTEGTNPSILQKLYNLLTEYFNKIILKDDYKDKLNNLTDSVKEMLLNKNFENYINTNQFRNKKFKMYSIEPHSNLVRGLLEQEQILIRMGRGSSENVRRLQTYTENYIQKEQVAELISLARRQANYIRQAINDAKQKNTVLSLEENMVFHNLRNVIDPALSLMKVSYETNPEFKGEVADIIYTQRNIADTVGLLEEADNDIVESIIDEVLFQANREDDENLRNEFRTALNTVRKDTNSAFSYFGMISQAQDPLLNLLGKVISDIYTNSNQDFVNTTKEFQKAIRDLGFKEKDLNKLMQEGNYRISKWDFSEFDEFDTYCKAQALRDNLDEVIALDKRYEVLKGLSDEQFINKFSKEFKSLPNLTDYSVQQKLITSAQNYKNLGTETFLSEKYMQEQEDRIKDLSDETKRILRNLSHLRGQARKQFTKSKNGVNVLTHQAKLDLDYLASERARYMNIFDSSGNVLKGISISNVETEGSVKIAENEFITLDRSVAIQQAIIAFELNKYNSDFIKKVKEEGGFAEGLTELYRKDLADMEADPEITRQEIIDWFNYNTSIGFSNKFFEGNENTSLIDQLSDFEDEDVQEQIKAYNEAKAFRRNLLKQYKDSKNSLTTNVEAMPEAVRLEIKKQTELMENLYSSLRSFAKGAGIETDSFEKNEIANVSPNEAYFNALEDYGYEDNHSILNFTKQHMTKTKEGRVDVMYGEILSGNVTEKTKKFLNNNNPTVEDVIVYAQANMLPYYSSFSPVVVQEFYNELRNSNKPLSELLTKLGNSEDVRLSPTYEYLDNKDSDKILNPNRDPNFKGGVAQPSLTKKPTLFGRTFDFNNKNWKTIENDSKLLQLHNLVNDFQYNILERANHSHGNIYLKPQVPKTTTDQLLSTVKGGAKETVKEWWQSFKDYRIGEADSGERDEQGNPLFQSDARAIPKYFIHKLENESNVSPDLAYSLVAQLQQATLRKYRVDNYSKVSALEAKINSNQRYSGIGLKAESTNTYRMAKSYIDNALFGIEDIKRYKVSLPLLGEVDLTKTLKWFHRWKQNISLALNPIVAGTGFLSGSVNYFLGERWVEQYISRDSMNKGRKSFYEALSEPGHDMLAPFSKRKNALLLEYFNMIDLSERFKNRDKGIVGKLLSDLMYLPHKIADFPIKSQIAYGFMHDHRIYEGKVLNYESFKRIVKNDVKWGSLPSLYDFAEFKDGKFSYNQNLFNQLNMTEEQFKKVERNMITKAQAMAQRVDGTIRDEERTFAQRNFALRYTQTHKGWLALAGAYRFKGRHFNTQTSQWEEGSYATAYNMITKVINNTFKGNIKDIGKIWSEASPEERVNIQRVLKELGVLSAVYLVGHAFMGFADDDEDDYVKQLTAYMSERVINETSSANIGVVKEFYSSLTEPIVGIKQLGSMLSVHKLVTGDEIVERGRYAGLTEREQYIVKNFVGGKPLYDLSSADNIKSQRDSYTYFNQGNDNWIPISWFLKLFGEEENEE